MNSDDLLIATCAVLAFVAVACFIFALAMLSSAFEVSCC